MSSAIAEEAAVVLDRAVLLGEAGLRAVAAIWAAGEVLGPAADMPTLVCAAAVGSQQKETSHPTLTVEVEDHEEIAPLHHNDFVIGVLLGHPL